MSENILKTSQVVYVGYKLTSVRGAAKISLINEYKLK